ncbi:circadian clock-controlled protein [Scaptodrosophila lebanonensis]|uniref:Circadian clock-controlled protein n=1 Tax=Drosophila lebanonensis TaxID=7225 RepID=A0A6J2TID8_DROLE|nr:circadian clock-controlled protein [Scaptodrosophila lebanonensis]
MEKCLIIFLCFLLGKSAFGVELPADIKKCHYGEEACIVDSINHVIKSYTKGIPEIGLPPLDAIKLKDLAILNSTYRGPVWFNFYMRDFVNRGFENSTVTHVKGFDRDPTKRKIEIKAHIPRLVHEATYEFVGRWLLFQANTTGDLESDFQNFSIALTLKVILEYRNNRRYLKIYELVPLVELDRWIIRLDNLYNENTDLTVALTRVFNENWVEFWNGLEPGILDGLSACFTAILNEVFQNVAYDDMFLPDHNYEE